MPLDMDGLKARKARRSQRGMEMKTGDNRVRIFPHTSAYFKENLDDIAIQFRSHFLKAEGQDTNVVRCLRDKKEECKICAAVQMYKDSADPMHKKAVDQVKGSNRFLFNMMNLNDVSAGVTTYESGPKLYDDILAFVANPAWGDVLSPQTGRSWTITVTEAGKSRSGYREYQPIPDPDRTDISAHLPPDFVERLDDIQGAIPPYPDEATQLRWLEIFKIPLTGQPAASAPVSAPPAPQGWTPPPIPTPQAPPVMAPPVAPPTPATPSFQVPPVPAPGPTNDTPPFPVNTAVVHPFSPPAPAAPVYAPPAPTAVLSTPPLGAAPADPVVGFCQTYQINPMVKDNKVVPECYSGGVDSDRVTKLGFNPQVRPCQKGCPVSANCQLKSLGLQ